MQHQINDTLNQVKLLFLSKKAALFPPKKQFTATPEQKTHLQIVSLLTKITQLIDNQPVVMKSCEEARFMVANAPLGTIPRTHKVLLLAVTQLETVVDQEPQIRRPLGQLKPLIREYLKMESH